MSTSVPRRPGWGVPAGRDLQEHTGSLWQDSVPVTQGSFRAGDQLCHLDLLFISCVTLDKLLKFSGSLFVHLLNGDDITYYNNVTRLEN